MERRPLELYIHIPFCVRKCAYCDFLSGPATDLEMRVYVEQLVQEISVQSAFYEGYGVTSIFLGGGTPSILEAEDISRIMEAVYGYFHVEKDAVWKSCRSTGHPVSTGSALGCSLPMTGN